MKTKLFVPFLIVTILGVVTLLQERSHAQIAADAVAPLRSSYLVAAPVCLQDSSGQTQRIFTNADITVGQLDTGKYRLFLSSAPDSNAPFIVDDAVFVNGQKFKGCEGSDSPFNHLGENPDVCYHAVPALDVTGCLRHDGHVFVQCMDLGGSLFGCSALYLRVVPK